MQPLNPTDHLEIATVTQKAELAFCPGPAARSESPKQKYMGPSRLAIQQRPASWCYFTVAGQRPIILSDEAATVRCQAVSLRLTQRQKIDGYASSTRNSQHTYKRGWAFVKVWRHAVQRRSLRQKRPLNLAQAWACNLVELFGDPGIRRWADCRVQVGAVLQHADAMSQRW